MLRLLSNLFRASGISVTSFMGGLVLVLCLARVVEAERIQVDVEGVYRGGENESFATVMELARKDAMRQAAEQLVGVYIRQRTVVETWRLKHQELMALTQALVRAEELTSADSQRAHYHATGGEGRLRIRAWMHRAELDRQVQILEEAGKSFGDPDAGTDSLGIALQQVVGDLARRMGARPDGRRWLVHIGRINDAEWHFPSQASGYVRDRLGIFAQEHWDLVSGGSEDGHRVEYDAQLNGTYRVAGDRVLFHVKLEEPRTKRDLALGNLAILQRHLPEGLSQRPALSDAHKQHIAVLSPNVASADVRFQVEVWPDRGDGATYYEGDTLLVRLRVSQDGYVRIFHTDKDGSTQPLCGIAFEQTQLKAGVIYTLPHQEICKYTWTITQPFGIDKITAIASSRPFSEAPPAHMAWDSDRVRMRGAMTRGLSQQAWTAEAFCAFRTQTR